MESIAEKVLGLSRNERKLLKTLKTSFQPISDLSKRSGLPRMTVYSVLASLSNRELVQKIPFGNRYRYSAKEILIPFPQIQTSDQTIKGTATIMELYRRIFSEHAGERVYAIQSAQSAKNLFRKDLNRHLTTINTIIKRSRIIIDVITSPALLELSRFQSVNWKKSMLGRTTSVTLLPDQLLDLATELWIFEDAALVTNWRKEICILQRSEEVIAMYRALYAVLKETGRIFDSNEFLRKLP